MIKLHIHQVGMPWLKNSETNVTKVKPVSEGYKQDGSPDGIVLEGKWRGTSNKDGGDDMNFVLTPETLDEVNGLIRQLGELKSRMLKAESRKHTVFGK